MIWSERRNFCFIHIPKTGGSAITFAYLKAIAFGDVVLGGPQFAEQLSKLYQSSLHVNKHSFARTVAGVVGMERFQDCFSFAVLRDPMARLVSYYRWLQGKKNVLGPRLEKLKKCDTFKEFVRKASRIFVPQADYVLDSNGTVLVSELLIYEHLAHDWPRVSQKIGVSVELPIKNKSLQIPIAFDASDERVVRERYRSDFELIAQADAQRRLLYP